MEPPKITEGHAPRASQDLPPGPEGSAPSNADQVARLVAWVEDKNSTLPHMTVSKADELPSRGLMYPPGWGVRYRSYSYAEVQDLNLPRRSAKACVCTRAGGDRDDWVSEGASDVSGFPVCDVAPEVAGAWNVGILIADTVSALRDAQFSTDEDVRYFVAGYRGTEVAGAGGFVGSDVDVCTIDRGTDD